MRLGRIAGFRTNGTGVRIAILLGVTSACSDGPPPTEGQGIITRDSTGLQIIEHQEPLHVRFWAVDSDPVLKLGSPEVEGALPFFMIRGAVVARASASGEARLVVADGGSRELRVFSMGGDLISVMGGAGEGPGEFSSLDRIVLVPPDTVLALDPGLERISLFHVEEGFLESSRLDRLALDAVGDDRALGGPARFVGRASDGSIFVEPLEMTREPVEGLWSAEWLVVRLEGDGSNPTIVGRFFRGEQFVAREGPQASVIARPFGRRGEVRVAPSELLVIDGSFSGYRRHSLKGEPLGVVRTHHQRQPVTSQERDRWREERTVGDPGGTELRRRLRRQAVTEVPFPEAHPAVDRILLDPCGFAWLRAVLSPSGGDDHQEWLVFRLRDHRWMGIVRIHQQMSLIHIEERYLVSSDRTDLGEEVIQVIRIDRSSAPCEAQRRQD
jgi:hypothetical protein